jgi:hypothetical protein
LKYRERFYSVLTEYDVGDPIDAADPYSGCTVSIVLPMRFSLQARSFKELHEDLDPDGAAGDMQVSVLSCVWNRGSLYRASVCDETPLFCMSDVCRCFV